MSKNGAHLSDFVEWKGAVQVYSKEVIPSYVGTVWMAATVNKVKLYITLNYVMYSPKTMHNLISIAQARKNCFKVWIDDDPDVSTFKRMELHRKPIIEVKMCRTETH